MTLMIARGARRPRTGGWVTVFSQTLNSNAYNGYFTYTMRQVIGPSLWSPATNGTKVRITLESATINSWTMTEAFIGQQAGSGDVYDFASTPTRITFNGGNNGFAIAASTVILSDDVTFAFDATKSHVIAMDFGNAGATGSARSLVTLSGASVYNKIADDAQTVDASGYAHDPIGNLCGIKTIEVFS